MYWARRGDIDPQRTPHAQPPHAPPRSGSVQQVIGDKFKKIELARINELELVEHLIGRRLLAQNASWKDRVYVKICEKDGTLIYIVVLSSNESIIFLSYR